MKCALAVLLTLSPTLAMLAAEAGPADSGGKAGGTAAVANQQTAIAVFDAGAATSAGVALKPGEPVNLNQEISVGSGPMRLLVPGLGKGELTAQAGSVFTIGVIKQADATYEFLVTVARGTVAVEGASAKAALKAVRLRGPLVEAVAQDGGAILAVGADEGGDRVVAISGQVEVSLTGTKNDPWQRASERLTLSARQQAQARPGSGLELVSDLASRPTLAAERIDWGQTARPGGWKDDQLTRQLGGAAWDRLMGAPSADHPNNVVVMASIARDSNMPRSTDEPEVGVEFSPQVVLNYRYAVTDSQAIRVGAQGRIWEYFTHPEYRLWLAGANLGWEVADNGWFGDVTGTASRFWSDGDPGLWKAPVSGADVWGARGDLARMVGSNLISLQASATRERYLGEGGADQRTGWDYAGRVGFTTICGVSRLLDFSLRGGAFRVDESDSICGFTYLRPSFSFLWRLQEQFELSGDYGYTWRSYGYRSDVDVADRKLTLHEANLYADWWFDRHWSLGPFVSWTYQHSDGDVQAVQQTYHRTLVGLRLVSAW